MSEVAPQNSGALYKMKIPNITSITQDTAARLTALVDSLKAWNLLTALYGDPEQPDCDLPAAYARQSRELVLHSIRQTHRLALAALDDDTAAFDKLLAELDALDYRERKLAALFTQALNAHDKLKQQTDRR